MTIKVCNAFSLNMVSALVADIKVIQITPAEVKEFLEVGVESCVGHVDTAAVFSQQLGVEIPAARVTVDLTSNETIIVGQYSGPRLPEGATTLPEGAAIKWFMVHVKFPDVRSGRAEELAMGQALQAWITHQA
jgi:Domain of unknown function (DUF1874)